MESTELLGCDLEPNLRFFGVLEPTIFLLLLASSHFMGQLSLRGADAIPRFFVPCRFFFVLLAKKNFRPGSFFICLFGTQFVFFLLEPIFKPFVTFGSKVWFLVPFRACLCRLE